MFEDPSRCQPSPTSSSGARVTWSACRASTAARRTPPAGHTPTRAPPSGLCRSATASAGTGEAVTRTWMMRIISCGNRQMCRQSRYNVRSLQSALNQVRRLPLRHDLCTELGARPEGAELHRDLRPVSAGRFLEWNTSYTLVCACV